jgi:hypothetical protein
MSTRTNMVRVAALAGALAAPACTDISFGGGDTITGSGPVVSVTRSVGTFTAVSNATLADIEILQSGTERLRIRGQENLLPYIRTQVSGGVLRITTEPGVTLRATDELAIELDVRLLTRIESSGSGAIHAPLLDAGRLEIQTSGSGDIDLPSLLADTLVVVGSGSGEVTGTGNVQRQRLVLSGSGRVDTRELLALDAHVTISGSGTSTIRVRDRITAVLSGSGSLHYYGSPQVTQTVTGSGRVERAGN